MGTVIRECVLTEGGEPQVLSLADVPQQGKELLLSLNRAGVVQLLSTGPHMVVRPQRVIGEANTYGFRVEVRPARPPAFKALLHLLSRRPTTTAAINEVAASEGEEVLDRDAILRFTSLFFASVDRGMPVEYAARRLVTSRPVGRIDWTETIRLCESRGVSTKVACRSHYPRWDKQLQDFCASAAATALFEEGLPPDAVRRLRLARSCLPEGVEIHPAEALASVPRILGRLQGESDVEELIKAAEAILRQDDALESVRVRIEGSKCDLFRIDRMWEEALFRVLDASAINGMKAWFHPFACQTVKLLDSGGPDLDPDIAIRHGEDVLALVDAKSAVVRSPVASDVYQIVCYVDRLRARLGAIVYLTDGDSWQRKIGITQGGATIIAVGISTDPLAAAMQASANAIYSYLSEPQNSG